VGPGGGVTQLVAGSGVTLDPATGEGVVTITATGGGGGGGVTSLVAGAGIGVSSPAGDVTVTNTGVTSLVAGTGISLSGASGAVTVTNSATTPSYTGLATYTANVGSDTTLALTGVCGTINFGPADTPGSSIFGPSVNGGTGWHLLNSLYLTGPFNGNSLVFFNNFRTPNVQGGGPLGLGNSFQSYSTSARWDAGQNRMICDIFGSGNVPSWGVITGQTFSIEFIVVQRS